MDILRLANICVKTTKDKMWSHVKKINVQMCGDDILSQVAAVEQQFGLKAGMTKRDLEERVDCSPEPETTPELCENKGCVWGELEDVPGPYCNFPNYTTPLRFDNITTEDLKTAAEMFIYLDYCPFKSLYAFYRDLFENQPLDHIILTLNRLSKLESGKNNNMNRKLLEKTANLLELKYKEIQNMIPGVSRNNASEYNTRMTSFLKTKGN